MFVGKSALQNFPVVFLVVVESRHPNDVLYLANEVLGDVHNIKILTA